MSKSYLQFEVWQRTDYMKSLVELSTKGNPQGLPDVFNDAWREQYTNTTISRMLQSLVVDQWERDKAFAEALEVLRKIYGKYAWPVGSEANDSCTNIIGAVG